MESGHRAGDAGVGRGNDLTGDLSCPSVHQAVQKLQFRLVITLPQEPAAPGIILPFVRIFVSLQAVLVANTDSDEKADRVQNTSCQSLDYHELTTRVLCEFTIITIV